LSWLHAEHRSAICAHVARCDHGWRPAERRLVGEHEAISQFLLTVASAEVVWAVTVVEGGWVVRFTGISADGRDSDSGGELATVLDTLRIRA
jgi:hypothetical protein